jgi:hypothetical protein
MTAVALDDDFPTAADRQSAAQAAYRASVTNGHPLTGTELGRMFDRTDRWGRYQISQAQAEDVRANGPSPAPRDATEPPRDRAPSSRDPGLVRGNNGSTPFPQPAQAIPTAVARPSDAGKHHSWLDTLITLAVALVAAAASYGHMLEVAQLAGEPLWLARAFPITVDGLVLAAIRRGEQGRRWLALGAAISIAANVLAQFPDQAAAAGPIVSAWPPLALYGTHRLLHSCRLPHPSDPEQP